MAPIRLWGPTFVPRSGARIGTVTDMPRERITPGTVGAVSVAPLGHGSDSNEIVIPAPRSDGDELLPYPKGWRAGQSVKVTESDGSITEYELTRWRGLARAVDVDGRVYMIRRWRDTRAAAFAATERAGLEKLAALADARADSARAGALAAEGDLTSAVADLIAAVQTTPAWARLADTSRVAYGYAIDAILASGLATMLPRNVDAATIRQFLAETAIARGKGGAKQARAVLRKAFDLAVESSAMRVPTNPVLAARAAVPDVRVRDSGLDHKRAPSDREVEALLAALRADPEADRMAPGIRHKSAHGKSGKGAVNGKDIADLALLSFRTGERIGELGAAMWGEADLAACTLAVTGTLVCLPGRGTIRQPKPKTAGSARTVPLSADAVGMLRDRAAFFGIDLASLGDWAERPIFGSPQFPERWRDRRNLSRAVAALYDKHGLTYARGHAGRKWRVTSLVARGVPINKVADVVGHKSIATTLDYLGRQDRANDPQVIAAL